MSNQGSKKGSTLSIDSDDSDEDLRVAKAYFKRCKKERKETKAILMEILLRHGLLTPSERESLGLEVPHNKETAASSRESTNDSCEDRFQTKEGSQVCTIC